MKSIKNILWQLKTMNCKKYKIGIFNRSTNSMVNKYNLNNNDIIILVPWLKFENLSGKDIFIGQSNYIDRALILVDDLSIDQIQIMRLRGVTPACVIETSPANYQAWVSLGDKPMSKEERKIVAVALADEFNGDKASTDANHYGRLAGFTNRKPKYHNRLGYPFVRFSDGTGQHAEKSDEIRSWATSQLIQKRILSNRTVITVSSSEKHKAGLWPDVAFNTFFNEWSSHYLPKDLDYSRGDFAVASRMLKEGFDSKDIIESIINNSPNITIRKAGHIEDYAIRTVRAAAKKI
jgi:hypothetical protein